MSWSNSRKFREWAKRRMERGSKRGRALEAEVEQLLSKMKEAGKIDGFICNPPNSPEDRDGKDFAIMQVIDGEETWRSFGVTHSAKCWHRAKWLHSNTPQFCFPIGTNPGTMEKRFLDLFPKSTEVSA